MTNNDTIWINLKLLWVMLTGTIVVLLVASCAEAPVDEAQLHAEVDAAAEASLQAYAANEVEAYFEFFTDDATISTSGGEKQIVTQYYESWKQLISSGGGVSSLDADAARTIRLSEDGNSAVVLYPAAEVSYLFPDGSNSGEFSPSTSVWAETWVWSKINGAWKIIHLHYHSVAN